MRTPPPRPNTPYARLARSSFWFAALAGLALLVNLLAMGSFLWPLFVLAVFWLSVALYFRRLLDGRRGAPGLDQSSDLIARGELEQASALLDTLAPMGVAFQRAIALQRAMIALAKNDATRAREEATRAIGARRAGLDSLSEVGQRQVIEARAHRALASASLGDEAGVRADAALVRAAALRTPGPLARVTLAEAMLLARPGGDTRALSDLLRRERQLLLENLTPRQRAVLRTLQRSVHRGGDNTAYRTPKRAVEEARPAAPLRLEWRGPSSDVQGPAPNVSRVARMQQTVKKTLVLWAVLIVVSLGVWQMFGVKGSTPQAGRADRRAPVVAANRAGEEAEYGEEEPAPSRSSMLPWWVGGAVGMITFGALRFINARTSRRFTAAQRLVASDIAEGDRAFAALARSRLPLVAGASELQRAYIAYREARFEDAIACCDRGLQRLAGNAMAALLVIPQLHARRATALAAVGRSDEVAAALQLLSTMYPTFPFMTVTLFRTSLVRAAREGDLRAARDVAEQRTLELPLDYEEDTLVDAVLTSTDLVPHRDELAHVENELEEDARLRAWVSKVWPGSRRALDEAAARAQAA